VLSWPLGLGGIGRCPDSEPSGSVCLWCVDKSGGFVARCREWVRTLLPCSDLCQNLDILNFTTVSNRHVELFSTSSRICVQCRETREKAVCISVQSTLQRLLESLGDDVICQEPYHAWKYNPCFRSNARTLNTELTSLHLREGIGAFVYEHHNN